MSLCYFGGESHARAQTSTDDSVGDGAYVTGPQDNQVNEANAVVRLRSRRHGDSPQRMFPDGPLLTMRPNAS